MSALGKARQQEADRRAARKATPGVGTPANDWPEPVPLDAPRDPAPAFPTDVLPSRIADLCRSVGTVMNSPVDYAAAYAIGFAAGAIGAQVEIEIKPDYRERACLYIAAVGGSSASKTPPMSYLQRPVVAEQSRRIADLSEIPDDRLPSVYEHGQGEILVGDVTVEKLGLLMLRQPRGLTLSMPELVAWLRGQNAYKPGGKGSDRQFYLQSWDGSPVMVSRLTGGREIWVPRPTLSVIGGVQPDIVREFLTIRDGFAERILWVCPDPLPAREESFLTVEPELRKDWEIALGRLWGMRMREDSDGRPTPEVLKLGKAGRQSFRKHTKLVADRRNDGLPEQLQSAWGKYNGIAARLALVLQVLDEACGGPSLDEIGSRWMEAASRLVLDYFAPHCERAYAMAGHAITAGGFDSHESARRIVRWALRNGRPEFRRSEAYAALRGTFPKPADLAGPLDLLCDHQFLRELPDGWTGHGCKPTKKYAMHPALIAGRVKGFEAMSGYPATPSPDNDPVTDEPIYEYGHEGDDGP